MVRKPLDVVVWSAARTYPLTGNASCVTTLNDARHLMRDGSAAASFELLQEALYVLICLCWETTLPARNGIDTSCNRYQASAQARRHMEQHDNLQGDVERFVQGHVE